MEAKNVRCLSLAILMFIGICILVTTAFAQGKTDIKELGITALPMPSSGYTIALAFSEAVYSKTGVKVKVISGGSDMARILPLKTKEAHFATVVYSGYYNTHGLGDYAMNGWGPEPLRYAWVGIADNGLACRGDAGIKTIADLKGKKVVFIPGNYPLNAMTKGLLAFANLTEKDVIAVNASSSTAGWDMVISGRADCVDNMTTAPKAYELQSSNRGICWPPLPEADKEGWKRLWKICPYLTPYRPIMGAGVPKDRSLEISLMPYVMIAYRDLPVEYTYIFVKGVWEGRDLWVKKHPLLSEWTKELALDYKKLNAPYHDGAVKFFKEIGKWTPDMEKWQKKQVELENKRLAAWPKAVEAAKAKKIDTTKPEFADFWERWLETNGLISYPAILEEMK